MSAFSSHRYPRWIDFAPLSLLPRATSPGSLWLLSIIILFNVIIIIKRLALLAFRIRTGPMFVISSIEHWITLDSNNNIYSDHFHKIFETKSCSLAGVIKILIINYIIMNNYFSVRKLGKYQILRTYYVTILTTISVRSKRGMTGLDARIQVRCFIRGWLFSFLNCWIWDMLQLKF